MREYFKVGGAEFVGSVLTQITNNRFHDVLAQITRDNFFLWKDKDKKEVCVDTNHNKQLNNHRKTSESIQTAIPPEIKHMVELPALERNKHWRAMPPE